MMRPLLSCVCYLLVTGLLGFLLGRLLPKNWFRPDRFPYKSYPFERDGKIYQKMKINRWQNKVPDMSRILPWSMPAKNMTGNYRTRLLRMIQETCVAELIHILLCFSGLYCLKLWPGLGGVIVVTLYIIFFNLPFLLIQRYNRPRLVRLEKKQQAKQTEQRSTLST